VSIQRVWERDSRTVVVRWNLRCFPRILDNVMGTMVNLDGLSEYHFNDAGFVQMHKVCPSTQLTKPVLPVIAVAMTELSQQPPELLDMKLP
jgi:hypothetical protein